MPRRIFSITGADAQSFLQGLITNDVSRAEDGLVYAALLTPQGKYIADFFVLEQSGALLLDADAAQADALVQRLNMYRLRADVSISEVELHLHRGLGEAPVGAHADPRSAEMGWRAYRDEPQADDKTDWDARRVAHLIPAAGRELGAESYILEMGFERLNGIDFRKGCYLGQEIAARMKHKTTLRKGLARVEISGAAPEGSEIIADGKTVGMLHTQSGGHALAYLRFDRAVGEMRAGEAILHYRP